jgi:hypothetical protein
MKPARFGDALADIAAKVNRKLGDAGTSAAKRDAVARNIINAPNYDAAVLIARKYIAVEEAPHAPSWDCGAVSLETCYCVNNRCAPTPRRCCRS